MIVSAASLVRLASTGSIVVIVLISASIWFSACFGLRWVGGLTPPGLDSTCVQPPRMDPAPRPVQHPNLTGAWCLKWGQRMSAFFGPPNPCRCFGSGFSPSLFRSGLIFGASARDSSVGGRSAFALGGFLYQAIRKLGITGQSPRRKPRLNTRRQQLHGHRGLRTHVLGPPDNSGPA